MVKNEKGLTLIELLVSMLILTSVVIASLQFFETYYYEKKQLGEHITAKHLAVKAIEEHRALILDDEILPLDNTYQMVESVNGISFYVVLQVKNETDNVALLAPNLPFVELVSTVEWKKKKMEVHTYVTPR